MLKSTNDTDHCKLPAASRKASSGAYHTSIIPGMGLMNLDAVAAFTDTVTMRLLSYDMHAMRITASFFFSNIGTASSGQLPPRRPACLLASINH